MASIEFKNVTKTYDNNITVIKNLNFEVKDKEFVIFVGPSGCGKSTTLRMIAGLEEVSDGEIKINGKRVNNIAPKDRDIAMVFQSYALYPHMTVYKNMAFALKLRREKKDVIDKKVREAAKILELEEYLDRKPKALSGGQRQRVALGRAMVRNPSVFLLDEPLSNLDAKLRTQMRSQIAALHSKLKTTFIYVTHDQTEAMTMADRIVVMKDGEIKQFDTPENLYSHPKDMFVAGFIGTPQMNFIEAELNTFGGEICALIDDTVINLPKRMTKSNKIKKYDEKKIILGIRSEDIYVNNNALKTNGKSSLELNITLSEMTGSETFLYGNAGKNQITVRVKTDEKIAKTGSIKIYLNTEKAHIFDKETSMIICD